MTMQIARRQVNGVAVLDLAGRLVSDMAETDGRGLRTAIVELTAAGRNAIALNLAPLTDLDACGLGQLVLAWRAAREAGARLTVVAPSPRVRRMLAVTRLDTVFEVRATFEAFGPLGSFESFERSDRSAAADAIMEANGLSSALAV